MEEEKSALQKWLPSLKKPEYVGMPKTVWVDLGRISDELYTCAMCHHHSPTLKQAITHLKGHSDKKTFECEDCDATFNLKTNLESHRHIHFVKFENKLLKCPICQMTFRRRSVFRRHILTRHTLEDDFRCRECAEKFPTVMRLELHKLTHLARFERRKRMQQKRIDRLLKEKEILKENEEKETGEENEPDEVLLSLPPPASVSQVPPAQVAAPPVQESVMQRISTITSQVHYWVQSTRPIIMLNSIRMNLQSMVRLYVPIVNAALNVKNIYAFI